MQKERLLAFSDGVIAIIITIMVLELHVPHSPDFTALMHLLPVFLSYVLSFIYVAIYWNNHHHMLHTVKDVNGKILWANTHLLFWLSLIPFATAWMGENPLVPATVAVYGMALLMAAVAYFMLQNVIIAEQGKNSLLHKAVGDDWKGKSSPVLYATGIVFSFLQPWIAVAIYVGVALMWIVPDRRIEKQVAGKRG